MAGPDLKEGQDERGLVPDALRAEQGVDLAVDRAEAVPEARMPAWGQPFEAVDHLKDGGGDGHGAGAQPGHAEGFVPGQRLVQLRHDAQGLAVGGDEQAEIATACADGLARGEDFGIIGPVLRSLQPVAQGLQQSAHRSLRVPFV